MPQPLSSLLPPNLLPDSILRRAFIAGGYAACPELATDIDLWVEHREQDGNGPMSVYRLEILDYLSDGPYRVETQATNRQVRFISSGAELEDGRGYDDMPVIIEKVAIVTAPGFKPIHIMLTDRGIKATMHAFDISTHQVGIDYYGHTREGADFTPLNEMPIVLRETPSTPARLTKITNRYAHYRQETADADIQEAPIPF